MRVVASVVSMLAACSFVGASVPDHPPPPEHCPESVVVLDIAGTGLFLAPATGFFVEGLRDHDGLYLALSAPAAMLGLLYLTSTIYGFHEHGRCQRMKAAAP